MPKFFVAPADPSRFPPDVVYLDASVTVGAHPPFKVSQVIGASGSGRSHGGTSVSVPHASNATAVAEDMESYATPQPKMASSSATNRKRARTPDQAETALDDDREQTETASPPPATRETQIMEATMKSLVKDLTLTEFNNLGFRKVRLALEAALGCELTPQQRETAIEMLRSLMPLV